VQNTAFSTNKTLNVRGKLVDLSTPKVMGILNVTPDSFYDGGRFVHEKEILDQTEKMLTEGATFIDVGAYSTRPGASEIDVEEEKRRAAHAITTIYKRFPEAIITVDTFRSTVAMAAIEAGASIVNDVSGGELDSKMLDTIAALKVPYIMMHMRGTPQNMIQLTTYNNLIKEITDFFHTKLFNLKQQGIHDVIIDPGFGFAKNIKQNFELLHHLDYFKVLGRPILVGLSRKSMIWKTLNVSPEEALNGTTALNTIAAIKGAAILRVHDVREALEVIRLCEHLIMN
jgi:dihydropteroate synthase